MTIYMYLNVHLNVQTKYLIHKHTHVYIICRYAYIFILVEAGRATFPSEPCDLKP